MILNLTPRFKPLAEKEVAFEAFTFAGGEPHIKIQTALETNSNVTITSRVNSFNDLGLVLIAVDALRRMNVKEISLFVPYFPAARQDRLMITGEPLTAKVYADLINSLNLSEVIIFDVHSDVVPALLSNCRAINNHRFIAEVIKDLGEDLTLISPDGGALKKIYKLAQFLGIKNVVECSKTRDTSTGQLSGFKVYADNLSGQNCLIVDDICDGGGTFLGLADALKEKGANSLSLAVSHGIFSNGLDLLASKFNRIYSTESIRTVAHEKLTQIPFNNFLNNHSYEH